MSLSAVTAPLAHIEKRYLYLNRIYWPPQRRAFQLCPEASGQGLPLQQENSQRPQHGPTPFTASPNYTFSLPTAGELRLPGPGSTDPKGGAQLLGGGTGALAAAGGTKVPNQSSGSQCV